MMNTIMMRKITHTRTMMTTRTTRSNTTSTYGLPR